MNHLLPLSEQMGHHARRRGEFLNSNPFRSDTVQHGDWNKGWYAARPIPEPKTFDGVPFVQGMDLYYYMNDDIRLLSTRNVTTSLVQRKDGYYVKWPEKFIHIHRMFADRKNAVRTLVTKLSTQRSRLASRIGALDTKLAILGTELA